MSDLYQRATRLENTRWLVARNQVSTRWVAFQPIEGRNRSSSRDRVFPTHAEAIAYADKEARK